MQQRIKDKTKYLTTQRILREKAREAKQAKNPLSARRRSEPDDSLSRKLV
jgi:hypothetical protein